MRELALSIAVYDSKTCKPCWGAAPDPGVYRIGLREAATISTQKAQSILSVKMLWVFRSSTNPGT